MSWFALRVRSQREASVADYLNAKGYQLFFPRYSCRKRWSDRIKQVELPLFPGYLFCRFDPYDRLPILKTPWLLQIVGFDQNPCPVDDAEINAIRTMVVSGAAVEPCPFLTVGEKARIESGPLRGITGILTDIRGNHKLVVSVTMLQRSVAVEIDSSQVTSEGAAQQIRLNPLLDASAV